MNYVFICSFLEEIYRTASHFGHAANLEMIAFAMAFAHGNTFLERQPQATAVALEREGATQGDLGRQGRQPAAGGPRRRVGLACAWTQRGKRARARLEVSCSCQTDSASQWHAGSGSGSGHGSAQPHVSSCGPE